MFEGESSCSHSQRNYSQNLITTVLSHCIYLVSEYREFFFKPSILPREGSYTCPRAKIHVYPGWNIALISLAFLKCLQPLSSLTEQTPHCTCRRAAGLVFMLLS